MEADDDDSKTPPEGLRRVGAALAPRSGEARSLATVAVALATAADQLRAASERYDGVAGSARQMLRSRVADALERARDACDAAVTDFAERGAPMNWTAVPWKKLVLLALAGAAGAAAAGLPEGLLLFGFSLQKVMIAVTGILAGWAKRAPGDIKAMPPP